MALHYVNLEPQYQKTSLGMEVGEVMEGEGTTYLRRLKLHGQNAPKTASLRHCEKIVLLGGT